MNTRDSMPTPSSTYRQKRAIPSALSDLLKAPIRRVTTPELRRRRCHPAIRGNVRRNRGFSPPFGEGRGSAVDRYYIEMFLDSQRHLVTGRGLEVHDPAYLHRYSTELTAVETIDIDAGNPEATMIVDICEVGSLPPNAFDCQIVTQTLHLVRDPRAATANLYQALSPGGSLLLTDPALSNVEEEMLHDGWRFLPRGLELMARECADDAASLETFGYGNRISSIAFLMGLALEDLRARDLEPHDPICPLISALRLTKPDTTVSHDGEVPPRSSEDSSE